MIVLTFARSIGAAFGVAFFGTLLSGGFAARTHDLPTTSGFDAARPDTIGRLPGALRDTARDAFARARPPDTSGSPPPSPWASSSPCSSGPP